MLQKPVGVAVHAVWHRAAPSAREDIVHGAWLRRGGASREHHVVRRERTGLARETRAREGPEVAL
jgi:hypothetical protein